MGLGALVLTSAAIAAMHFERERSGDGDPQTDQAIFGVETSLAQAVAAAEQAVPQGRAVHADFEQDTVGRWHFALRVQAPKGAFDVQVDPTSGKSLSVAPVRGERD